MLKDVFRLPQHNEKAGCCWLCPATPDNMRDASAAAPWRVPWCTTDLVQRLLAQGHLCSPLFSLPAFTINMFKLDWLHIMDLGVAADVAGNVLWVLQGKMPGANVKMRVSKLYLQIAKYYKETGVQDKLNTLTETMIRKSSATPPKLTAGAAECRHLIPWLLQAAKECLNPNDAFEDTVIQAISCLSTMYDLLSNYARSKMRHAAGRLALLLAALRDASEDPLWRMKPKVHLMLHLAENLHRPAETWTYRDEDYGGSAARSMRSRGGTDTPKVAGENLLQKFCCRHDLPTALGIGKCDCSAPAFHSLLGVV